MDVLEPRDWYVTEALQSVARLNDILSEMTEAEVLKCLDLESQTSRRISIIDRLISRAVRLNELTYVATLRKKYHGHNSTRSF
jgi:hypothetical protein